MIQTFFPNKYCKYFPVSVDDSVFTEEQISAGIKQLLDKAKIKEQQRERDMITNEPGKTENSPWLTRTDWKHMFMNQNMKILYELTRMETCAGSELALVKASVPRV